METGDNRTSGGSQQVIREAIRKIALGRGMERVDMAPAGTSGVGTARMIHGYVAKVHDDPTDEEYGEYAGTVDVGEFPDETASSGPVIHKGVLLAGTQDNAGGFLVIPTLFSDVTIVTDAATRHAYVVNYSHAKVILLHSHAEAVIGVVQTEEMDAESDGSPDYDELEKTGNESSTRYTPERIIHSVKDKNGKEVTAILEPESITTKVDESEISQHADKVQQKVGSTALTLAGGKVTLGDENATEPLVLGNRLAQLMLDFITECSKITTPTLMGTMPAINAPNFASLTAKIQDFLSQTSYTQ